MIDENEYLIFINELHHLIDEYKKCKDDLIKEMIAVDILFLEDAIIKYYSKN